MSRPSHTEEQIAIDGDTRTRYEWTQRQRQIESAVRRQKDIANAAKASGDDVLRREAQRNINDLKTYHGEIGRAIRVQYEPGRMGVSGFRAVKTVEQLKIPPKSGIIITDKQLGKKAGKHMAEWNLDQSNATDRIEFARITREIVNKAEEARRVEWNFDNKTGKRTKEVTAYILGKDVVLVDDAYKYITTMKDGINNLRIAN